MKSSIFLVPITFTEFDVSNYEAVIYSWLTNLSFGLSIWLNKNVPGHGSVPMLNYDLRPDTRSLYVDDNSNYLYDNHVRQKRGKTY